MDSQHTDDPIRQLYRRLEPQVSAEGFCARFNTEVSRRKRRVLRGPVRVLAVATLTLVLAAGLGTGVYEAVTHLSKGHTVLVLTDQPSSTAGTTSSSFATPAALLPSPYPPGSLQPSVDQAPPGPSPRHRESAWATKLAQLILQKYADRHWVVVSAFEVLEDGVGMTLQFEPREVARLGPDQLSNAAIGVVVSRGDQVGPIKDGLFPGASQYREYTSEYGQGFVRGSASGTQAILQRPDFLCIRVNSSIVRPNEEPFALPLDENGVRELADYIASIIELDKSLPTTTTASTLTPPSTTPATGLAYSNILGRARLAATVLADSLVTGAVSAATSPLVDAPARPTLMHLFASLKKPYAYQITSVESVSQNTVRVSLEIQDLVDDGQGGVIEKSVAVVLEVHVGTSPNHTDPTLVTAIEITS